MRVPVIVLSALTALVGMFPGVVLSVASALAGALL